VSIPRKSSGYVLSLRFADSDDPAGHSSLLALRLFRRVDADANNRETSAAAWTNSQNWRARSPLSGRWGILILSGPGLRV
jgi:hypothetical protein